MRIVNLPRYKYGRTQDWPVLIDQKAGELQEFELVLQFLSQHRGLFKSLGVDDEAGALWQAMDGVEIRDNEAEEEAPYNKYKHTNHNEFYIKD